MKKFTEKERELIRRTKAFVQDDVRYSAKTVIEAHVLFFLCSVFAVFADALLLKGVLSVFAGLFLLRCFVLYHDYLHGAILRNKRWAEILFRIASVIYLTPKAVWTETHNYHHAHNSKIPSTHIGSYKLVTTSTWNKMTAFEKSMYKWIRHPANMVAGFFTVFFIGMIVTPLFRNVRKNRDALFVLTGYVLLFAAFMYALGFQAFFFAILIPQMIAAAIGSYLFFVQHNFPSAKIQALNEWSFNDAALDSSSFMKMHPIMHWFSANIGYHHVHHLNPRIPFYRLPEAMAAIPELTPRHVITLSWKDMKACLAVKLWDESSKTMVGYG